MSEESRKHRPSVAFCFTGLAGLSGLYLASLGPFVGAYDRGWISEDALDSVFHTVYFPIACVDDNTDFFRTHPVGKAYGWYVDLWVPGAYPAAGERGGRPPSPPTPL